MNSAAVDLTFLRILQSSTSPSASPCFLLFPITSLLLQSLDLQQMSLYLRVPFLYFHLMLSPSIASSIPCFFLRRWISRYISTSAAWHYDKHFNSVPSCNFASEFDCSLPGNSGQRAGSCRFFSVSGFFFCCFE